MTLAAMIKEAEKHLGYEEGGTTPFGIWYEDKTGWNGFASAPWCDMFLGYCADKAGELKNVGLFAYTPYHVNWFKKIGKWHAGAKGIQRGDIVFFDWDGGEVDHVGMVTSVDVNEIHTIEGNTNNRVMRRVRAPYLVRGFGRPAYGSTVPMPDPTPKPEPKPGVPIPRPALALDGDMGPLTVRAFQRVLNYRDGSGLAVDGDWGPLTTKAFQRALNRGKL